MTDVFSPKQKSALGLVKSGGLRRINLLEGSVRSGKTWISMIMWGFWVASAPENGGPQPGTLAPVQDPASAPTTAASDSPVEPTGGGEEIIVPVL